MAIPAAYGTDDELLDFVANKQALRDAFPLDGQRSLAHKSVLRFLRRQGLEDDAIEALGAEALDQLKVAENCRTLAGFFSGFADLQAMAHTFAEQSQEALEAIPLTDDDPHGSSVGESQMGLG